MGNLTSKLVLGGSVVIVLLMLFSAIPVAVAEQNFEENTDVVFESTLDFTSDNLSATLSMIENHGMQDKIQWDDTNSKLTLNNAVFKVEGSGDYNAVNLPQIAKIELIGENEILENGYYDVIWNCTIDAMYPPEDSVLTISGEGKLKIATPVYHCVGIETYTLIIRDCCLDIDADYAFYTHRTEVDNAFIKAQSGASAVYSSSSILLVNTTVDIGSNHVYNNIEFSACNNKIGILKSGGEEAFNSQNVSNYNGIKCSASHSKYVFFDQTLNFKDDPAKAALMIGQAQMSDNIQWDDSTSTLTLSDAVFGVYTQSDEEQAIVLPSVANVIVIGENEILENNYYDIFTDHVGYGDSEEESTLTVSGTGKLRITSNNTGEGTCFYYDNVIINDCTLDATAYYVLCTDVTEIRNASLKFTAIAGGFLTTDVELLLENVNADFTGFFSSGTTIEFVDCKDIIGILGDGTEEPFDSDKIGEYIGFRCKAVIVDEPESSLINMYDVSLYVTLAAAVVLILVGSIYAGKH